MNVVRPLNIKGFTLVEIVIVIGIIGLLAALAMPNYISARLTTQQNTCLYNIKALQNALELAGFDDAVIENLADDAAIQAVVMPVAGTQYLRSMPSCPTNGSYFTDSNGVVHCSTHAP